MKLKDSVIGLFSMVAMATLAVSCNASYPGQVFEPDPDKVPKNDEENTEREDVPISIYTKDPGYFSLLTRGTGAFDDGDLMWSRRDPVFYVFSFRVGSDDDGFPDLTKSAYSPRQSASEEKGKNENCLLDGISSYNLGMPFHFQAPNNITGVPGMLEALDINPEINSNTFYYSSKFPEEGYNFFGCHIDDFKPNDSNTHREKGKIWYNIDLDGYRDIMLGYADSLRAEDFAEEGKYAEVKTLSDAEVKKILSMGGGYSKYSGSRNIYPVINMRHQLARMAFRAYAADPSAADVTITDIVVEAAKSAKMVVAGRTYKSQGMEYSTDKAEFHLSERPDEIGQPYPGHLRQGGYGFEWIDDKPTIEEQREENKNHIQAIGSSLLLAPSTEYVVKITFQYRVKQNGGGYKTMQRTAQYRIKPSEDDTNSWDEASKCYMFKAGVYYTIDIAVWGLQKLELKGNVESWKTGGDISIDPDDEE